MRGKPIICANCGARADWMFQRPDFGPDWFTTYCDECLPSMRNLVAAAGKISQVTPLMLGHELPVATNEKPA